MIKGHLHPITQFIRLSVKIFEDLGFEILEGPEIEEEKNNFDLLNMPKDHPARDIQDTFYLHDGRLLRTHTSAMQIRSMESRKPPVRIVVPGRVYRHEATDSTHEASFYHLEGFVIDRGIQMSHLIWTLKHYLTSVFGKDILFKLVPHYYPFVEPGMDVLIKIQNPKSKIQGWIEVLGSGMIHPVVLKNMGVDSHKFSGFAFGLGIDRLIMLYYGIDDIRFSYSGDLRFLKQF